MKFRPKGTSSLSNQERKLLDRALELARTSLCRQRHGALVVLRGKVVARGINRARNHPDLCSDPKTEAAVHAEIAALRRVSAGTNLRGAVLYVARSGDRGAPLMSKPCERCQAALRERGIRKIVFTVDSSIDL